MLSTLASNALTAKAHALRSKKITEEQYRDIIACKSVSDICSYLQSSTRYSEVLQGTQTRTIRRLRLENLIKELRFVEYGRLVSYAAVSGESFYGYVIIAAEIEQILQMLRYIIEGSPEKYALQYPHYLNKYFDLNLERVSAASNFDELLEALDGTDYKKWLEPCKVSGKIDYLNCDIALFTNYYQKINNIIRKSFSGDLQRELSNLFEFTKKLRNIRNIYRVKRFFPDTPAEELNRSILPMIDRSANRDIVRLSETRNSDDFINQLKTTGVGRYFDRSDAEDIEYRENIIRSVHMAEKMNFRTEAPIVFTAYMTLSEIEVSNLITIIECKYYEVPTEEIRSMLVIGES